MPIAEVQSFSVVKGGKMLERTLNVMGSGTLLASVNIPHGTAEKIEEWFRRHPLFRDNAPMSLQQAVLPQFQPNRRRGAICLPSQTNCASSPRCGTKES